MPEPANVMPCATTTPGPVDVALFRSMLIAELTLFNQAVRSVKMSVSAKDGIERLKTTRIVTHWILRATIREAPWFTSFRRLPILLRYLPASHAVRVGSHSRNAMKSPEQLLFVPP